MPGFMYSVPAMFLLALGIMLAFVGVWEANRMSAKNIEQTRARLQNSIDDGMSKLQLPS
jgi:hypothetical protein